MLKLGKQLCLQNGSFALRLAANQLRSSLISRNYSSTYDGDGKTTVRVLNNDPEMGLMVNSFSEVSSAQTLIIYHQ